MIYQYPTNDELKKIDTWDFKKSSVRDFIEFVRRIWWMPDFGFELRGKNVLVLDLHTGGWSGNESIIEALKRNFIFWAVSWVRSEKGGYYRFKIHLKIFKDSKGGLKWKIYWKKQLGF